MHKASFATVLYRISVLAMSLFLAFSLVANLLIYFHKTPGTFEYIRKAEIFLERRDYPRAIEQLETAAQSSPDSKTALYELIHAYSEYGKSLASLGKYEKGIEYLLKAYQASPDGNTMRNLALLCEKKALVDLKGGARQSAAGYFEKARVAAAESEEASRALAITLHNDAIEEAKAGGDEIAIVLLEESLLANEDSRSAELLGDIYYRKIDMGNARFYWQKAAGLNPPRPAIKGKLEKIAKEIRLAQEQGTREMLHFELRYEATLTFEPAVIQAILEQAYVDVGSTFNYYPAGRTFVFLYNSRAFADIFKMPSAVRAFYDGNIRMPLPDSIIGHDELRHYLYHEYTHALVSSLTANNCPTWFNEGLAVWQEFRGRDSELKQVIPLIVGESATLSLESIDLGFKGERSGKDMRALYLKAFTVIKFMVDTWGIDHLRSVLKRISSAQHILNAIDDEYLIPEKEFQRRWIDFVERIYFT